MLGISLSGRLMYVARSSRGAETSRYRGIEIRGHADWTEVSPLGLSAKTLRSHQCGRLSLLCTLRTFY